MDLPILEISNKWNYTTWHFCIWILSLNNVFSVHSCYSIYQYFIPFYIWIIFYHMDMPHFVYHSSIDIHLGCFFFWALQVSEQTLFILLHSLFFLFLRWYNFNWCNFKFIDSSACWALLVSFSFQLLCTFQWQNLYLVLLKSNFYLFIDILSLVKHHFHTSFSFFRHDFI